ncbi:unannotated protein [freshwater metagenome]|uniref:Unannotated protein n=1 Tax=freshwater metagenome TaxID=449393 RepID=A0A6J6BCA6_9ZZZZ
MGSTSYSKTGTFSGTFTQFSADAGSGFASSAITKESATLSNGTCGSYSAGTAPTGGSISETTLAEGCYRYTVTGTDKVGNTSVLLTVVMVDKTAPTQVISATGSNAYVDNANSKIYYNGSGSSRSFTMTSAVTEAGSGGVTVTFPSLAGTSTGFSFTNSADSSSPFTSNSVTWSSGTTSTPTITVNATDAAGNSNDKLLTFVNDITNPSGGALTIAGFTTNSTSNNTSSTPWSITKTDFTDAGSGISTNALTYTRFTTSGGVCTSTSDASGTITTTSFTPNNGKCYEFVLTGTDNVGRTNTVTVYIRKA